MEEQISNIKKETPELEEVINENNNIIKSQEKVENQSTCNLKDNTNIKISPFFNKNSNGNERKKNVHSLKLDKKKLKLHTNKKLKKNKKSNQNIFALSFFKNLNEKSNLDLSNNQNENSKKDEKSASEIVIPSKEKEDNISLSQSSQALNEENKNENKNDDNNSEENSISQLKNNIEIDSDSQKKYESQKCPICNMCLDFYTFKEREKHVNLCIDSSIRKENKKNLFNKKEDNKISFFYKNIKNTDNNEKIKDSNYSTNIQTEFITDTPNDIILDNSNISTLPSNNQFKCKICDEEACFSTITELYSHLFQCFSKIESDHFFFKEKLNFILNQNECFCCMKPWPEFEEKAAHIKECIAIKKNYMEKIENLMKYYLKQKKEKEKAFLEKNSKNSKYRHFKGSIYLKKKNPDSIPDKMKEIEGENKNSNTLTNTESIFNLNKYDHKNKAKENNDEKKTTVVDQNHSESKEEEKKVVVEEEEEEEDIEESYDTKCCFCNEDFENSEEELIVKHIEICIKEKMKFIEDTEDTKYKPRYIQKLTRCPCCSKKWLEYSMANLKEKLTHIFECSSKNGVSLARISIILNQCKSRFKEEEEKAKAKEDKKKKKKEEMEINDDNNNNNNNNNNKNNEDNSNSNSNSNSNDIKENKEKMEKFESKNDLNTINETSEEIKDSIRKRKVHNSQEENNIIVLNIEDESSEDFKSNSLTFRLSSNTSNNARSYRQRTLYDDIEEDQLKLAKALSKSLYQDENQKIRLKIMNTSTVLSVEDAHSYNFSRANSLFNLTQQKYSLWEMSMLNPEDILKAETVIEPLQKYSYDIRMTLKNEGIDEYISTITFPVPDRRLLKVSSIEGIDKYFNDQVNNRKLRLDKYKKLLTLQTSLWIKKMRKKQHSLKKELLTLNLENPEDIKNTRIFNDVKLELNEINNNNNNDNNNKSINSNNIDENDNIVNDIEDNNSLKIIDDSSDTYNDINNNIDDIKDNDSLEIIDDNNNDYNSFNNKIHDNKDNDESIFISQMNSNKNINNNDLNNDSSIDEIVDTNDTNDEFFNIDDDMIID